ncbi:MAG: DNA polymerase III subunit gamma/tau [Candidatus Wallbacteria bacterium]|nr:DNA polymerase III subunit gamma/tau [Candidatus Wallbacteria bacterium]
MSLYLKYRPRNFSALVGQGHVVTVLKNALAVHELNHAYLFCGPRGSGKTTTARILTKAINCLSPAGFEPCLQCANCKSVENGTFLDMIEIDAASNRRVEDIRDLRDKVIFAPQLGRYKIYIIDEAHMLTKEAFNAFLKMLEEPPAHTIFILATTEPEKFPPTIISRCQRHNFRRVSPPEIADYLKKIWGLECASHNAGQIDYDALLAIARISDGALRDSLSLLEQLFYIGKDPVTKADLHDLLGILPPDTSDLLFSLVASGDLTGLCHALDHLMDSGASVSFLLHSMVERLKELLLQGQSATLNLRLMECLINALEKLRWHPYPRQVLDLALIKASCLDRQMRPDPVTASCQSHTPEPESVKVFQPQSPAVNAPISEPEGDRFQALLFRIGETHPGLAANLSQAHVSDWDSTELKLVLSTPFEYKYACLPDRKSLIENAISDLFGEQPRLTVELGSGVKSAASEYPPLVKKALELFGGEIVSVINQP